MMFEHLLESNNLNVEFERCGLGDKDIQFIKEQIAGPLESEMSSQLNSVSVQVFTKCTGCTWSVLEQYTFFDVVTFKTTTL